MEVARDVVNADGRLLVRKGVILTHQYIWRMRELGVGSVYIASPGELPVYAPDVLADQTRMKAIQTVRGAFDNFRTTRKICSDEFQAVAANIIDELMRHPDAVLHLTDIRTYDDYTFGHCVNVCVLAVLTGIALGYSRDRLRELALGCLLHDLGKMAVPAEILNKPGKFTEEEMEIVKTHTIAGFEVLRNNPGIPLLSAHIAFQHQERLNGTGYPRGLKGNEIHEYARVAAVADVYDALTSDRPYRKRMMPHEAYEIMIASIGDYFEESIIRTFFEHIALYPVGTVVKLNSGAVGVVVGCHSHMPLRPVIQVLLDADGNLPQQAKVDLTTELTIFVAEVLEEAKLVGFYKLWREKTAASPAF